MKSSQPISLAQRRAMRKASVPDALTLEALRKSAVGRMRYNITKLIEDNAEQAETWLWCLAQESPKDALDAYIKLLEYGVPKLSRAEVSVEDGGKTKTAQLTMDELRAIIKEARTLEGEYEQVDDAETDDGG